MHMAKKKNKCFCLTPDMIESYEQILESPQYELFVNIIGIFNILCIVVREVDLNDTTNFITVWIYI